MSEVPLQPAVWEVQSIGGSALGDFIRLSIYGECSGSTKITTHLTMINTQDQRTLLHTWIILVIVKQHLVKKCRIDGRTEYSS